MHLLLLRSGTISVYHLYPSKAGQSALFSYSDSENLIAPTLSHILSLKKSLNSTASGLATGRVTCLSW